MIRSGWVGLVAVFTTLYYGVVVLANRLRPPAWRMAAAGRWAKGWAAVINRAAGVRVIAAEMKHVDPHRSQIIVANHQSWFDVLALFAAFPTTLRFVAKDELRSVPIFGAMWETCGHIAIARGHRERAVRSLRQAARRLREHTLHLVLFAEGTRSPTGALQPFKKGAFVLAIETGVPVLPVAISGSREVMPKGSYRIRPGLIKVRAGAPIPTGHLTVAGRNQLRDRTREAVSRLLERDEPERSTGRAAAQASLRAVGEAVGSIDLQE